MNKTLLTCCCILTAFSMQTLAGPKAKPAKLATVVAKPAFKPEQTFIRLSTSNLTQDLDTPYIIHYSSNAAAYKHSGLSWSIDGKEIVATSIADRKNTVSITPETAGNHEICIQGELGKSDKTHIDCLMVTVNEPPTTNRQPVVENDSIRVYQDIAYASSVVASDPDGDPLVYSVDNQPALGAVVMDSGTGNYTYTPKPGISGVDSFSFIVSDGISTAVERTVSVTIVSTQTACDGMGPYPDSDKDGFLDIAEVAYGTNPLNYDSRILAYNADVPFNLDADNDGYLGYIETWLGADPNDSASKPTDSDIDGIPNCFEPVSDGTKAILPAFNIPEAVIDASTGTARFKFDMTVLDNAAGINNIIVMMRSPLGTYHYSYRYIKTLDRARVAPVHIESVPLNQYLESGDWMVVKVLIYDEAKNISSISTAALEAAGFPTTIKVVNPQADISAPEVTRLGFSEQALDVSSDIARIPVEISSTDNVSGIKSIVSYLISPSGVHRAYAYGYHADQPLSAEQVYYSTTLDKYSEAGEWSVYRVYLEDWAGNRRYYSGDMLAEMGFDNTITIVNPLSDIVAPELEQFDILTPVVDPSGGQQTFRIKVNATDAVSGTSRIYTVFRGPSGQFLYAYTYNTADSLNYDGEIVTPAVSEFLENGVWSVYYILLYDNAGNTRYYRNDGLKSMGWETDILIQR